MNQPAGRTPQPAAMPPLNLPSAGPSRVGQGTAIEQSRAGAEVFYSVLVAQQSPRNEDQARASMLRACQMKRMAEKAFYEFPRSGQTVSGASVYLARELARCWGNIQYGVAELRRDDEAGESEMQAYAWDLQTNARSAQIFIVPHKRDKRGGPERITEMRDIYENNANAGARRVREAIFAVLPMWFTEEAQEICRETLRAGDGVPLEQRIENAVAGFGALGISEDRIAAKLGKPRPAWDEDDVASLGITYNSIKKRELTKDEAFPAAPNRVTSDELTGGTRRSRGNRAAAEQEESAPVPEPTDEDREIVERFWKGQDATTGEES